MDETECVSVTAILEERIAEIERPRAKKRKAPRAPKKITGNVLIAE